MRKIIYLIECFFSSGIGRFFNTAKLISKQSGRGVLPILLDMIWCGIRYGAGHTDYRIFDFVNLSPKQRATFVTRGINNEFIRKLNNKAEYYKFEDKSIFNRIFRNYIGRDWILLEKISIPYGAKAKTIFNFIYFIREHPTIIAKPVNSVCGKGILKINATEGSITGLFHSLVDSGRPLIEEYIYQNAELRRFYPLSINTIRIMTIIDDYGQVNIMFRGLRIGTGGSVVDNFNAGGILVLLDKDGFIVSDAINKDCEIFKAHPDTNVYFKGIKIPYFKEAEEMIISAARVVPSVRYVSWDVAITPNGPIIVEGNHNPGYDLLQSKVYLETNEYGRLHDFRRVIYGDNRGNPRRTRKENV